MNRVNVFAVHRCINEGYGLIQISTEKIRISPTKLWRVCVVDITSLPKYKIDAIRNKYHNNASGRFRGAQGAWAPPFGKRKCKRAPLTENCWHYPPPLMNRVASGLWRARKKESRASRWLYGDHGRSRGNSATTPPH